MEFDVNLLMVELLVSNLMMTIAILCFLLGHVFKEDKKEATK